MGQGHRHDERRPEPLIPFPDALAKLMSLATPVDGIERVGVEDALGRVVAEDVRSQIPVPAADLAAMDGYAVRSADTRDAAPQRPVSLRCTETLFAGVAPKKRIRPGTCAQIATGATVPPGADAVVMVEVTERREDEVRVTGAVRAGENVSRKGADIRKGGTVVRRGDVLSPARVGALAAVGRSRVAVYRRPRVAILTTGDEVVEPGTRLRAGQVYDINSYTLAAVVRENGGHPDSIGRVGDDRGALQRAIRSASSRDIVVVSGGSSVGERDLLVEVLQRTGKVLFHGVAIKPGRPTALGLVSGTPILGMPGFSTSCLSNAYVLLAPAVRAMARLPPRVPRVVEVTLAESIESPKGRLEFHTVRIEDGRAVPAFKESSTITSMAHADGYIEIPADVERVERGQRVRVVLF